MNWTLRYAPHLGFRSLETPLFLASVGSADPLAQIAFVASQDFAGVQDPWFATRSPPAQERVAAALSEYGLAAGSVVCGTPGALRHPLSDAPGERARRLGAEQIAVLTGEDPATSRELQIGTMIDNLRWAADVAASEGLALCLEPTNARTLPCMLLHHSA